MKCEKYDIMPGMWILETESEIPETILMIEGISPINLVGTAREKFIESMKKITEKQKDAKKH